MDNLIISLKITFTLILNPVFILITIGLFQINCDEMNAIYFSYIVMNMKLLHVSLEEQLPQLIDV